MNSFWLNDGSEPSQPKQGGGGGGRGGSCGGDDITAPGAPPSTTAISRALNCSYHPPAYTTMSKQHRAPTMLHS
eukprot:scaffold4420_cov115-Isochrysis_galbana.AAC.3